MADVEKKPEAVSSDPAEKKLSNKELKELKKKEKAAKRAARRKPLGSLQNNKRK